MVRLCQMTGRLDPGAGALDLSLATASGQGSNPVHKVDRDTVGTHAGTEKLHTSNLENERDLSTDDDIPLLARWLARDTLWCRMTWIRSLIWTQGDSTQERVDATAPLMLPEAVPSSARHLDSRPWLGVVRSGPASDHDQWRTTSCPSSRRRQKVGSHSAAEKLHASNMSVTASLSTDGRHSVAGAALRAGDTPVTGPRGTSLQKIDQSTPASNTGLVPLEMSNFFVPRVMPRRSWPGP